MLAKMASELPEALFFFDSSKQCIWANSRAIELAGLEEDNYENAAGRLDLLFDNFDRGDAERYTLSTKDKTKSFVFEKHSVNDEKGRIIGSFLSVRDNTEEQEALKKEMYNATHDSLTSVYNRAGYNFLLSTLDLSKTYMLVIDVDEFKEINDMYGHEIGDKVLLKITNTLKHYFRSDDYICRIGGDEFVVFMAHSTEDQEKIITNRIERINADLENASDGVPPVTVSVGAVLGKEGIDAKKMFDCADVALYDRKRNGKNGVTFY
jgi:diguanylate cyclase (GGDEF)-like protein